jgi:hypothetical protein
MTEESNKKSPLFPEGMTLDDIVFKCASFMHDSLDAPKGYRDFDIIQKYADDGCWDIHLRPNYLPDRIISFYRHVEHNYIIVTHFEETRKYNAIF